MEAADENISPVVINKLLKDFREFERDKPEGITLIMNDENIADVQAIVTGPESTPYEGGIFHLKLVLGPEFPRQAPRGFFVTKIFHPNIAANGDICVNTLKRDWTPDTTLKKILMVIRCLLIEPAPDSALNEEAAVLMQDNFAAYSKRARLITTVYATGGEGTAQSPEMPSATANEPSPMKLGDLPGNDEETPGHSPSKSPNKSKKKKKKLTDRL